MENNMAFEFDSIRVSQQIFYYLITNSSLPQSQEPELFQKYVEDEEIMSLVKSQGEVADCIIERYGSSIYIMPNMTNNKFGFTRAELKKALCKSNGTNRDYYLSQFIILTIFVEFYDGQGNRCKTRDFMKMGELQNIVAERLEQGVRNQEEVEDVDDGLDYRSMSEAFNALKSAENVKSRAMTTKEGVIVSVLDFLEKQGLIIYIKEDEMIKTTERLDNIMEMKLLNKAEYARVMEAMGVDNEQD